MLPGRIKAVIAPHAGYVYSGPIAARAFRQIESLRGSVERIVLIGPAHRVALRGLSVPTVDAFATPLGAMPIDAVGRQALLETGIASADDVPHREEHCLEVELPFLQTIFGAIRVLPLLVGRIDPDGLATALECVWGGAETLIVVSSDLSHYHDYATAVRLDAVTARQLVARSTELIPEQACGAVALNGLMVAAGRCGLEVVELDRRNSGDTAGDRRRVVGYGAFALHDADE